MGEIDQTLAYKLIYIYEMPYSDHKGLVKVGETTLKSNKVPDDILPNSHELNKAAHIRIKQEIGTASMRYKLLYTELAVKLAGKYLANFSDKDVQKVLMNSRIRKVKPNDETGEEWFETNLETAKAAIKAVKNGNSTLSSSDIIRETPYEKIDFREEQIDAIEKTLKTFKKDDEMLWYAKMRFGKTLTALEVIRRSQYRRVIIVTHRPVVDDGWSEDFKKIFFPCNSEHEYHYERKTKDSAYIFDEKTDLENDLKIQRLDKDGTYFIYFASIQDLRGSKLVGGGYNKNNAVFALDWDLIVIDEAHEGTQTELGDSVVKALKKDHTKVLALSGTPFNLLDKFVEDNVYTWDYVMEQKKKTEWDLTHHGDHNPYADLPKMHIFTYDLGENLKKYVSDEYDTKAFNFKEFFKVWYKGPNGNRKLPDNAVEGRFVHEKDVKSFLDLMVSEDADSGYPFSTQEYRDMFRHTLWMVPGVKEAKALSDLLRKHPVFKNFGIANVAGEGDKYEEEHSKDALELVRETIKNNDYSITLSCGKLTTGVTVKEWTAVLMLSGSYSTAAAQYMQTIFRVQSAGTIDGKQKTDCYVFDFAPDRTLKVLTETVHLSRKPGKSEQKRREAMSEFLNYCPVIAISGSKTRTYSVESMMEQIKQIYAERAVNSGFDDESIYNDELLKLDDIDASKFNELKDIIGSSKAQKKKAEVVVNGQGLTDEQIENIDDPDAPEPPEKPKLTPEELAERERIKQAKDARKKAIDILRGISIRMPLMIYGADVPIEEDIDINSFVDIVDDESWKEFMPSGVTKEKFAQFTKYYDRDVFIAAGKRIRRLAAAADRETPTRRVVQIAEIFRHFKNPDKETVLTPWRVVNIHMSETLGGWCFYNEEFEEDAQEEKHRLEEPRFVDRGEVTKTVFAENAKILEINSKTGLYPLYVAYSFYKQRMDGMSDDDLTPEECQALWNEVVRDNVYVICKTPMAKSITIRTLCGYSDVKCNAHYFDDLVNMLKNKPKQFKNKILKGKYWGKEVNEVKFDAVVGNPPYQEEIANRNEQPPVYHYFYDIAFEIAPKVTLITPARYLFNAGKTPEAWNKKMLRDEHFRIVEYFDDSREIFPSVEIKGGVAIGYRDSEVSFGAMEIFAANENMMSILKKVTQKSNSYMNEIWTSNTAYCYSPLFFKENAGFDKRVSGGSSRYLSSSVFDKFPETFFDKKPQDGFEYAEILGRQHNERTIKYFKKCYLNPPQNFEKYKVFLASSSGSGKIGEAFAEPIIGTPYLGATETFFSFGNFDTKEEAVYLLKYLKTKFARVMLSTSKVTQAMKSEKVWINVPAFSFSENDSIDWSKTISEIDEQLFEYFDLSDEEANYIKDTAASME